MGIHQLLNLLTCVFISHSSVIDYGLLVVTLIIIWFYCPLLFWANSPKGAIYIFKINPTSYQWNGWVAFQSQFCIYHLAKQSKTYPQGSQSVLRCVRLDYHVLLQRPAPFKYSAAVFDLLSLHGIGNPAAPCFIPHCSGEALPLTAASNRMSQWFNPKCRSHRSCHCKAPTWVMERSGVLAQVTGGLRWPLGKKIVVRFVSI